jgi:HPt (histidine-containing phosphotransfer) domain-containing protein
MDAIRRHSACDRPEPAPPSTAGGLEPSGLEPSIARLAPRYLNNVEKDLHALNVAQAAEDYATIQRIGHNLNGTGGSFGFPRITELGAILERAGKDRATNKIRDSIDELVTYLEQVRSSLQDGSLARGPLT